MFDEATFTINHRTEHLQIAQCYLIRIFSAQKFLQDKLTFTAWCTYSNSIDFPLHFLCYCAVMICMNIFVLFKILRGRSRNHMRQSVLIFLSLFVRICSGKNLKEVFTLARKLALTSFLFLQLSDDF